MICAIIGIIYGNKKLENQRADVLAQIENRVGLETETESDIRTNVVPLKIATIECETPMSEDETE